MRIILAYFIPLAFLGLAYSANAVDQGHGKVQLEGSIVDTPCGIGAGSRYQIVDLSITPVNTVISDGSGVPKPFTITLSNCSLPDPVVNQNVWSRFSISFDGNVTNTSLFSVEGEASGIGIEISDKAGNVAEPGKVMPQYALEPDTMNLDFNARLVADENAVRPGNFQSTIRFKMDYY